MPLGSKERLAMKKLGFASVLLVFFAVVLSIPAQPDQTAKCTMDDMAHVAKYSCPDGYEVVYSGEGTKTCDGGCFKKGDSKSLQGVLSRMVVTKWGKEYAPDSSVLSRISDELLRNGQATLAVDDRRELHLKLPKSERMM
jgi:hypothetical protein